MRRSAKPAGPVHRHRDPNRTTGFAYFGKSHYVRHMVKHLHVDNHGAPALARVAVLSAGARPGERMTSAQAREVLKKLAMTASDLFETPAAAETYLESADIDGAGTRALDLIKVGRTASVLARFDELRYGTQG